MDRNQEYAALLQELEHTPEKLQYTVQRALAREKALQRRRRRFGLSAAGAALSLTVFVLLVNLSVPFARACGTIPLVRQLAKAVAWSPSLSAAVENEYVQPMGLSQTAGGVTATVEYVIVDQKQLNIFFTLKGDFPDLSADMPTFSPQQRQCSIAGAAWRQPPGTLLHYTVDYMGGDVPEGFAMTFGVTSSSQDTPPDWETGKAPAPPEGNYLDDLLTPREPEEPEYLAEFTFDLSFDPQFTQQGETLTVNRTVTLGGQTVTVAEAEIYPTHMRLNIREDEGNSRRLAGLSFYLENEAGERFSPVRNGILSSGTDDPLTTSYRLDSPFFAESRRLTLHITGARWQTEEARRIRVDLANCTADYLPRDVEFLWAERREGGWVAAFASPKDRNGGMYDRFAGRFWDEAGEEYEILSTGMDMGVRDRETGETVHEETMFTETFPLAGLEGDVAYLEAHFDIDETYDPPAAVEIKS